MKAEVIVDTPGTLEPIRPTMTTDPRAMVRCFDVVKKAECPIYDRDS